MPRVELFQHGGIDIGCAAAVGRDLPELPQTLQKRQILVFPRWLRLLPPAHLPDEGVQHDQIVSAAVLAVQIMQVHQTTELRAVASQPAGIEEKLQRNSALSNEHRPAQQRLHRCGQVGQAEQGDKVLHHRAVPADAVLFAGDDHFQAAVPPCLLPCPQVTDELFCRDMVELHDSRHHADRHSMVIHQFQDLFQGLLRRDVPGLLCTLPQDVQQHILFQGPDLAEASARHGAQVLAGGQQDTAWQAAQLLIKPLLRAIAAAAGQSCPGQVVIVKVVEDEQVQLGQASI